MTHSISILNSPHAWTTLIVFAVTLALIFKKPWNMHEAWATIAGAACMLLFGCVTLEQAWLSILSGANVLFFLLALMLFSALLDRAGFFDWCAIAAATAAKGKGRVLYRNVFMVGAAITAFLSLDTTAIILTPIVVSLVNRLKLESRPFLIACAFVSNTGSLLLPVSNLTNLLFQHSFNIPFTTFAAHMLLPQIVAIALNYLIFAFMFRNALPETYESDLPQPSSAIKNDRFFKLSLFVLAFVLIGYFVGSLCNIQPYVVALAGCSILLIGGFWMKQIAWSELRREVSWELFPFVIGLFVVVQAVENIGIASFAVSLLKQLADHDFLQTLATAFISGIGSNIVNNIPMALVAISIAKELPQTASQQCMFASLLGCNLGPNLTIFGSLATMLVITAARKRGEDIGAWDFFKAGAVVTPLLLVACSVASWVSIKLFSGGDF